MHGTDTRLAASRGLPFSDLTMAGALSDAFDALILAPEPTESYHTMWEGAPC